MIPDVLMALSISMSVGALVDSFCELADCSLGQGRLFQCVCMLGLTQMTHDSLLLQFGSLGLSRHVVKASWQDPT